MRDWDTVIDGFGQRKFVNHRTGEQKNEPPAVKSAEKLQYETAALLPFLKKTQIVVEGDTITTQEYIKEVKATQKDIGLMMKELSAVALIAIAFKRKVARRRSDRQQREHNFKRVIYRFMVQNVRFIDAVRERRKRRVTRLQALWRGHRFRSVFYSSGEYEQRWFKMKALKLAHLIYKSWKAYRFVRVVQRMASIGTIPQTFDEWRWLVQQSTFVRSIGLVDEYRWQNTFIYQHQITKMCTFNRPREFSRMRGNLSDYSQMQERLIVKMQALARGWQVRFYHVQQARAFLLADSALELYLKHPETDEYLLRYTLYCHIVTCDLDRARGLYMECFRRMSYRGPDNSFLLYAYAIFVFVNREVDFVDIEALITRAQSAELNSELQRRRRRGDSIDSKSLAATMRFGFTFKQAKIGYFERYAELHNTCLSWHQYAACLFIVYNQFEKSFSAFVRALDRDALNVAARSNLDLMLDRHFGDDVDRKLGLLQSQSLH